MCEIQRGLVSEAEGDIMTSQAGYHGRGSQPNPNQRFVKNKTAGEKGNQVLSCICFRWLFPIFCTMAFMLAFMLTHAHAEEQTGICQLKNPTFTRDMSSVANFETTGLCPSSSTNQAPMQRLSTCIPHGYLSAENDSPDPLGSQSPCTIYVQVLVNVLAIIGGIGLAGWVVCKRRPRAFTEADINEGLASEPTVPRQSNPTFEIHPRIN